MLCQIFGLSMGYRVLFPEKHLLVLIVCYLVGREKQIVGRMGRNQYPMMVIYVHSITNKNKQTWLTWLLLALVCLAFFVSEVNNKARDWWLTTKDHNAAFLREYLEMFNTQVVYCFNDWLAGWMVVCFWLFPWLTDCRSIRFGFSLPCLGCGLGAGACSQSPSNNFIGNQ